MDSESFGMRHRSAVRFAATTPGSVAFIVSQDGKVSLCWNAKGRTYLKRGFNTSNPNMVGT
jgi:DNA integrity scanning protein DisA with diadenylate cyclase activity